MAINSLGGLTNAGSIQQTAEFNKDEQQVSSFKNELDKAIASGDDTELKEAAKAFESYFINMMFKQMRSTINYTGGLFERSSAEVMFQEMLDEQYAEATAEAGGMGLAQSIYEQMKGNS